MIYIISVLHIIAFGFVLGGVMIEECLNYELDLVSDITFIVNSIGGSDLECPKKIKSDKSILLLLALLMLGVFFIYTREEVSSMILAGMCLSTITGFIVFFFKTAKIFKLHLYNIQMQEYILTYSMIMPEFSNVNFSECFERLNNAKTTLYNMKKRSLSLLVASAILVIALCIAL